MRLLSFTDFFCCRLQCGAAYSKFVGHTGPVYGVSFSPDNQFLLSGSEDASGIIAIAHRCLPRVYLLVFLMFVALCCCVVATFSTVVAFGDEIQFGLLSGKKYDFHRRLCWISKLCT